MNSATECAWFSTFFEKPLEAAEPKAGKRGPYKVRGSNELPGAD